jgi:hypothetical protein
MDWMGVRIWNACGNQYYLTGGSRQLAARPGPVRHPKMHTVTARGCAGSAMLRLGRYETVKAGWLSYGGSIRIRPRPKLLNLAPRGGAR